MAHNCYMAVPYEIKTGHLEGKLVQTYYLQKNDTERCSKLLNLKGGETVHPAVRFIKLTK